MISFIVGLNYGNIFNNYPQCNINNLIAGPINPVIGGYNSNAGFDSMEGIMNAVNTLDNNTLNNSLGLNLSNTQGQFAQQPEFNQPNNMFFDFMNMMLSFMMSMIMTLMQSIMGGQNPAMQGNDPFAANNTNLAGNNYAGNNYGNMAGNDYGNAAPVANNAPPLDLANTQGSALGQQIAQSAYQTANELGTTGWCAKGVRMALERIGINGIGAASAYMVADKLAGDQRFREVQCTRDQLKSLPPGAIVVWGRTDAHPHGHISIALGDGREASDHVQGQITGMAGSTLRVFIPVG